MRPLRGLRWAHPDFKTVGDREEGTGRSHLFRLLACLVCSVAATLANPYGWGVYRYAGRLSAVGMERGIEEWLPPDVGTLNGATWAVSLVVAAALVLRSWRRVTWIELCIVCCFAAPSFVSTRMTVWWFLAAAPVMARLAAGCAEPVRPPSGGPLKDIVARRPSFVAGSALALLIAACVLSMPWLDGVNLLLGRVRPAGRVEADLQVVAARLSESHETEFRRAGVTPLTRRLFTRMEWANYFAWACDGRVPVFVEGHVELYPPAVWDEYLTVNDARPGWQAVLERHGVDLLVLDRTYHARLLDEVVRSGQWETRGGEGAAVVFKRRRREVVSPVPTVAETRDGGGE